jgi:hypothetical protein
MRKMDSLSLIFIDFYVPALTSCLNSRKTSLHFLRANKLISLIRLIENFNVDNLYSKPKCHVVSKDFSISKTTSVVDMLLLKFKVTWSISLIHWSVMLCCLWKPNLLGLSRPLSSMCLWTIFRITFWNSLPA